jgi:hypothetical protein
MQALLLRGVSRSNAVSGLLQTVLRARSTYLSWTAPLTAAIKGFSNASTASTTLCVTVCRRVFRSSGVGSPPAPSFERRPRSPTGAECVAGAGDYKASDFRIFVRGMKRAAQMLEHLRAECVFLFRPIQASHHHAVANRHFEVSQFAFSVFPRPTMRLPWRGAAHALHAPL